MRWIAVGCMLALGACSPLSDTRPQNPAASIDAAAYTAVHHDDARALDVLKTLSADEFEGRQTGKPGNLLARQYIKDQLLALGVAPLQPDGYDAAFSAPQFADPGTAVAGVNLLARIEGSASPARTIVMSAHFDHLGKRGDQIFNGADDNASGVAALLELVAWFKKHPPENTIIFAFFDAEEAGLAGSTAFVAGLPESVKPGLALNLNLDMVARADKGELYAIGSYHFPGLVPLIDGVAETAPLTLLRGHDSPDWGDQDWSLLSDHAAFLRAGIPILYLGVEDHADYHQPSDTFERVDPEVFARSLDTIILVAETADSWVSDTAS